MRAMLRRPASLLFLGSAFGCVPPSIPTNPQHKPIFYVITCAMDGVPDTAFTNAAVAHNFTANVPDGGTSPATLWVRGDDHNLCVAVRVDDADTLASSGAQFTFHDPPQGASVQTGDERLEVNRVGTAAAAYVDGFWTQLPAVAVPGIDANDGGTSEGGGAVGGVGGTHVVETYHPLDTFDDRHDFSLQPGDSICINLVLNLTNPAGSHAQTVEDFPCYQIPVELPPLCETNPERCVRPELQPNRILLYCVIRGCKVVDPLPLNCFRKWGGECPGCPGGAQFCPGPTYRITLTDLDEREWTVDLVDPAGRRVAHERRRTGDGLELSFTPGPMQGLSGGIADYVLVFTMQSGAEPGRRYEIGARLAHGPLPGR